MRLSSANETASCLAMRRGVQRSRLQLFHGVKPRRRRQKRLNNLRLAGWGRLNLGHLPKHDRERLPEVIVDRAFCAPQHALVKSLIPDERDLDFAEVPLNHLELPDLRDLFENSSEK